MNKYYLGVGVLALIITTLAVSGVVSANESVNNFGQKNSQFVHEKQVMHDKEAFIQAIENNDYDAWRQVVGEDAPVLEKINEGNWDRFVEMHNHLKSAREISDELDLKKPLDKKKIEMMKNKNFANNEEVKAAFENNDYQSWVTAVGTDFPAVEKVTEENFHKMVEAHNLIQSGEREAAKAIFEEIGLRGFGSAR